MLSALAFSGLAATAGAAKAETRTLRLYFVHTGESATITFKRDGKFIPAGLRQLNQFLRDWRRNESTRMDPALFDLIWEMYQKTGSHEVIHVVSAYRSPATNNMLRSRTRGVAKNSMHTYGKAMDFFLPDVPLARIRETGLHLQMGGVGFYPTSGQPFVHMDTGPVRYWPRMTYDQLARVFPDGKSMYLPSNGKPLPGYEQAAAEYKVRKEAELRSVASIGGGGGGGDNNGGGLFAFLGGGGGGGRSAGGDDSGIVRPAPGKGKTLLAAIFGGADEEEDGANTSDEGGGAPAAAPAKAPAAAPATAANSLPGVNLEAAPPPAGTAAAAAPPAAPAADDNGALDQPKIVPVVAPPKPASLPFATSPEPVGTGTGAAVAVATPPQKPADAAGDTNTDVASADTSDDSAPAKIAANVPLPLAAPRSEEAEAAPTAVAFNSDEMPRAKPAVSFDPVIASADNGDTPPPPALGYAGGADPTLASGYGGDVLAETARSMLRRGQNGNHSGMTALPASRPAFPPEDMPVAVLSPNDPFVGFGGAAGLPDRQDPKVLANDQTVRSASYSPMSAPDRDSMPQLLSAEPSSGVTSFSTANVTSPDIDHFSGSSNPPMTASLP